MRHDASCLLVISLMLMAACAQAPKVDLEAEKAALLATDQAWSQSTGDLEKLTSFLADDAVFFGEGMPRISGKAAIAQAWGEMMKLPGFSIRWTAEGAAVGAGGDLGYTFGSNEISFDDAKGARVATRGKYVTIWRKQADGSWKTVVDIGNSDSPPPSAVPPKP